MSAKDPERELYARRKNGSEIAVAVSLDRVEVDGNTFILALVRGAAEHRRAEEDVLNIAKGVSAATGETFFGSLVEHLARALQADHAVVVSNRRRQSKTIAHWRLIIKHCDIEKAKEFFAAKAAFSTGLHEVDGMIKGGEDIVVVDVRLPSDFKRGHLPGAINLPNGQWHADQPCRRL